MATISDLSTPTPQMTALDRNGWPPPVVAPPPPSRSSWAGWTLVTIAAIWVAVALISIFSPDMVSGSEQQRIPIAALSTWLWGFGASIASLVAMTRLRGDVDRRPLWISLSGITISLWSAATVVSIFGPTLVTGSDPTTIPLGAVISPVVATLATALVGTVVLVVRSLGHPGPAR